MHKRLVFSIISRVVFIVCVFLLLPLAWAAYDNVYSLETNAFVVVILAGLLCAVSGRSVFLVKEKDFEMMNAKDALAAVGLTWIFLSLWGALPLWLSQVVPTFTDAFFEITSGLTTTGASIFTDIEILPRGILFWRSLTHWLGGMGVVVLYVALLPALGGNSFQLYKAETSGLEADRASPRLKENAKRLWLIYFLLSAICFLLLLLGRMPVFDALCHTFGAIATGGFSTQNASIGAYGPYVQWVITAFMFLGGVNFLLYYRFFQGKPLAIFKDEEFRFFSGLVIGFSLLFAFVLWRSSLSGAVFRDSFFQVVSILTATGFATANFDLWPDILRGLILFLMFVGGCAGSTSGGLKVVRLLLTFKLSLTAIRKELYPNAIFPVRFNGKMLSEKNSLAVLTYFAMFVLLIFVGTFLILVFESTDMITAISATLSAASSVGPGLAKVGPTQNFAWMSMAGKWTLSFLMIAGRLEMYAFLILFLPITWKK
jgi:trk system potassium uptake protein TrkH